MPVYVCLGSIRELMSVYMYHHPGRFLRTLSVRVVHYT